MQDVYYPYSPRVAAPLKRQLDALVALARRKGFPVKVALIGGADDLGAVTQYASNPQSYADFLGQELSDIGGDKTKLLVVMPNGYGTYGLPPRSAAALRGLEAPAGRGDALADQAVVAVPRLARAAGYRLPSPKPVATSSSRGLITAVLIGAPVVLVAVLAAVLGRMRRGDGAEVGEEGSGSG